MQLSVIILNYNVRYFLEQCIISVEKALSGLDAEIIVIDNASTDGSCGMMKQCFPHIKLIENKENEGFPKGNNKAVAEAKGRYICILNPDTVVAETTFTKVIAQHKAISNNIGIIGCKLIDGTGAFLPESKRGVPTPWVAFTKIFGLYKVSRFFGDYYAQHLQENQSGNVAILVGAFMFLERNLYAQVGGFDENCFMYSDDIDLSYTILQLGKQNFYCHETAIIHYKGESTIRDAQYVQRFSEAMQFFYKKHFKKSVFFDGIMQLGSYIFTIFKQKQQQTKVRHISRYVIFTRNNLKLYLGHAQIYLSDFKEYKEIENVNTEIIFDTDTFTFEEIITFMEAHQKKNISFKNYISKSNYLIGSNDANDRGEVILL